MPFVKIFFYLVVLILVLALAYFTTRMMGNSAYGKQQTKNMQILDRMAIGRDSCLLVVRIQEQVILLGVSPAGIVKLEELEEYEKDNPAEAPPDFAAVFKKQLKSYLPDSGKQKKNGRSGL